jgi:hypothetical protein
VAGGTASLGYVHQLHGKANGYEYIYNNLTGRAPGDARAYYRTEIDIDALPQCYVERPRTWIFQISLVQTVNIGDTTGVANERYFPQTLYQKIASVSVEVPASCVRNSSLFCNQLDARNSLHLAGDVEVLVENDGATVGGLFYEWTQVSTSDAGYEEWKVPGEYPLTDAVSATLISRSTCVPSPCDCTQSLTGMLVEFEGQTFTYGDLEEFLSEDGGTRWVESSAGLFYRYDYDPCDYSQQFIANQMTAVVFCTNEGGEDFWGVVLTNECYERSSCGGGYDATRGMQWSGLFDCVDGGGPQGQPQQPLALVYDIPSSDPAPSGVCVGTLPIPEFEFLAP